MEAVVPRSVVKEVMVDIQRVAYIHFCRVGHHDVRQNTSGGVFLEFVSLLALAVVDGLDATAGRQVILAGGHFDVPSVSYRAQVLHKPLAERTLADERSAVQVL